MKDYVAVIAAVIAGVCAIVAGVISWQLKRATDERERAIAQSKERRDELKQLYTQVFAAYEQAIRHVLELDEFTLDKERSEINARVNLLASEAVIGQYHEVASLLTKWSALHFQASPKRVRVGEHTATILQSPDPTAQFKEPERAAHEKLQDALELLVKTMRSELARANAT